MIDRHFLKLRGRDKVSAEEEQAIRSILSELKDVPADTRLVRSETELDFSILLLDGLACRFKDLRNGERQITELHVAGDFVDLHSFTLKRLDHEIGTLTPCRIATVKHEDLKRITEQYPHLTRIYWFNTNVDAAIHREWEVSLGRRTALARVAHIFCELYTRLETVGLAEKHSYALSLTQTDLAECLGLTSIHVNRTLKELRESGVVTFRSGRVEIADWGELTGIAEFNPSYLYLQKREL
jgi:CRP-like cAMP-binding protein